MRSRSGPRSAQLNPFYLQILGLLGINIIATVSLNFAAGFGGMFSLGHPAFMAIGGYTAAILTYPVAMKAIAHPRLSRLAAGSCRCRSCRRC